MVRIAILRLLESYFRHRWLYLVPIVLFTVAGVFYVFTREPSYHASGVLYVQNDSFLGSLTSVRDTSFGWSSPSQVTSGQIMELMQTDAFVRSVIEETRLEVQMNMGDDIVNETMDEARKSIWTQSIGNNQVRVHAVHQSPAVAMELSNAVINRFIQWQINLDRVQSSDAEGFMAGLVETYGEEVEITRDNLQDYLEAHPQPLRGDRPDSEQLEIERLQSALQMASQRYSNALDQEEGARLATSQAEANIRQTYFVVDSPKLPDGPLFSLRQVAMNGMIFVIIGFIFAGIGIVGAALFDRSFQFPVDVTYALALPVISIVPDIQPKKKRFAFLQRRASRSVKESTHRNITITADDEALEPVT